MFLIKYKIQGDDTLYKEDKFTHIDDAHNWIDKNKHRISWSKIVNKGGRPKNQSSNNHTKILKLSVSEEEFLISKKALSKMGYRYFSEFVRDALLKNEIRVRKKLFGDEESSKIIRQIGNNINQIAFTLNSFSNKKDRQVLADYDQFLTDFRNEFPKLIQSLLSNDSKNHIG